MGTLRAIGSYALDATDDEKVRALRMCLDDAISELVVDFGVEPDDVREHCESAVESAVEERES